MKNRIKQIMGFVLAGLFLFPAITGGTTALAADATTPNSVITVPAGQTEFSFSIAVSQSDPFCGVEFGLTLSDETALTFTKFSPDVTVSSVMTVPFITKNDIHYFGFYTSSNAFTGPMTIGTLEFTYTGDETQTITLTHMLIAAVAGNDVIGTRNDGTIFTVTVQRGGSAPDPDPNTPVTDPDPDPSTPGGSGGPGGTVSNPVITIGLEETPLASALTLISIDAPSGGDVVYYLDSGNKEHFVPFSLYKDGKIYFLGSPLLDYKVKSNPKTFTDVNDHWALDSIAFISSREIFQGYSDGSFKPDESMTRSMFSLALARMASADTSQYRDRVFADVSPDSWYGPSVAWAADAGITLGDGAGKFNPNDAITREEIAVMMIRFVKYMGLNLAENTAGEFADSAKISSWAADHVAAVQKYGLMSGKPGNLFDPSGFSTRAEIATVLKRLVEKCMEVEIAQLAGISG